MTKGKETDTGSKQPIGCDEMINCSNNVDLNFCLTSDGIHSQNQKEIANAQYDNFIDILKRNKWDCTYFT